MDDRVRTTGEASTAVVSPPPVVRTPDDLLCDALAIRRLLHDLGEDEHRIRAKLLLARDEVRREAARQWREHGWRPITDEF